MSGAGDRLSLTRFGSLVSVIDAGLSVAACVSWALHKIPFRRRTSDSSSSIVFSTVAI